MSLLYHLSRFVQYRLSVRMSAVLSSRLEQLIKVNFSPRSRRNEFKQVSFRLPVNYNIKGRDRRPGGGRFRMFCCKQFGSNYPMTCFSISFCDLKIVILIVQLIIQSIVQLMVQIIVQLMVQLMIQCTVQLTR